MSSIVKQTNKQTGTTYVYEQESYYVPGVGARNRRHLIGKIDPLSGEVVPTGKQGPKRKHELPLDNSDEVQSNDMKARLLQVTQQNQQLKEELEKAYGQIQRLQTQIRKASKALDLALTDSI